MALYHLFCLFGSGDTRPHRHESAPYTQSLYQTIIGSWLAYVQIEGSRLQRLYVGFFDWQQIQVDAVIESVPAIPTMFPNILFQCFRLVCEIPGNVGHIQAIGEIIHGQ